MDLSVVTRIMAAVFIEWNDLGNHVQIKLTDDTMAFWGTHAPRPKFSDVEWAGNSWKGWQLYIPNLTEADIERGPMLPAHDMTVLGMAVGVVSPI